MKRLFGIILIVAFAIFEVGDAIHGFISNDGFHYFSQQPHRLLLVAIIGIIGGLLVFGFSVLSRGLQRGVKLTVLGSVASFVMLAGGYLSFQVANLPMQLGPAIPRHMPWLLILCTIAIAGLLWFEFYQVLKGHDLRLNASQNQRQINSN